MMAACSGAGFAFDEVGGGTGGPAERAGLGEIVDGALVVVAQVQLRFQPDARRVVAERGASEAALLECRVESVQVVDADLVAVFKVEVGARCEEVAFKIRLRGVAVDDEVAAEATLTERLDRAAVGDEAFGRRAR
jgi:hypothetical protein